MFTLLFFSFLHITKAISTNSFCVCQPDRPGPVCTLGNKCSGFQNENQILVINKFSTANPQKYINLYSIINDNIRNHFNSSLNFVFDVYGSPASKPVIFDFNRIDQFARSPYNLNITIKIVGGEWKQAVQIIGSFKSPNHFLEPDNSLISFSAEQISILFDTPNPHSSESHAFHFDNLKLQKVVLKSKFGFPISIKAKTVLTDSYSMITEYNCTVTADSISMLGDQPLFQSKSIKTIVDHLSTEKLNKKNIQANVDPQNFNYKFCLTTIKNINRAMTVGSCSMHSVVNDSLHYITVRSTEVLDILANAPENKSIQFYVVETTASDPNLFVLPLFKNPNHNIAFQSANTFDPSTLTIRSSSSPQDINSTNISLSFLSFSSVGIDSNLLEGSTQISAKAAKLTFLDSTNRVKNLISDADSLSQFTGNLTVLQSMELSKTSPKKMNELAKIILSNQTTLTVSHLSNFPKVFFGKIDDYYVAFCDENADTEMRFFLQGGNVTFLIRDDQPIVPLTTMTFANLQSEYNSADILSKNFYLNFTVDVPESGLNLEFGQDDASPWPTLTTFSFQANHNYAEFPNVYITIKDFPENTNIIDYQFMNYYNVSIILTDPETFIPYFSGINTKYESCPLTLPPYFDPTKCYHVGTYSINGALFNIQDKLGAIEFIAKQKLLLYSDNETLENPIELPAIFQTSHMLTTTSKTVVYSVRNNEYDIDKTNYFYLVTSQPTRIRFNETFNWSDYGNVTKIGFLHDEYDLYLSTERNDTAVPTVSLSNSVTGVHYETQTDPVVFEIPSSDWFYANKTNTRRGPDVNVKLLNNVNVPQQAFLADRVNFTGNNKQMTFIILNETVATYTFEDLTLNFLNATSNWNTANFLSAQDESSAEVTFKAKSLIVRNTAISQDISKYPLHMEVGSLDLDSLTAIPSTSFSSPIVVNEKFSLADDSITRIVFSADFCQVFAGTKGTPVIQLKSKKSSASRSVLSFSRKLAEESSDDTPSNVIKANTNKQIVLSVNGNAVPEDFKLDLPNPNSKIYLDQSWYNVQVPQSFNLGLTGKPQISTDLLELPSGLATGNAVVVTRKQKYTNTLGFIIFLIISGVILLLGIILAILGKTCKPHKEELDVSSEDKEEDREVDEEMIPSEAASESNNDDYDGFDDETFAQSKSGATPAPSEQKNNNNQVAQPLSYSDSSSTIPDSSTVTDEAAKPKDKPAPAKEEETPKKEEKKKPSKRRNTISDDDELESISGNSD